MRSIVAHKYERVVRRARRLALPLRLLRANRIARSSEPVKPAIALVGNGRSGTSWIGRTLGIAPDVAYYRQPCHPNMCNWKDDTAWSRYVPINGDDVHFRSCLEKAFSGQFVSE